MKPPAKDLRSIAQVAPLVERGELSPPDLVEGCLERISARRELNAFITVMAESARAEARRAAEEISSGRYRGPLHGVPVSLKDLVDVAGVPTTSGSAVPARYPLEDAPIARRLREAGAIVIGKTNLHEFAFGTTTDETAFDVVRNPFDESRSAGGSSSGAAVALVEGMCYGSIGTDTGGSIRIPSAACGTVGLKPTYGELPCDGIVPLSTSFDHVGPMTRTVEDARIMFNVLAGQHLASPRADRLLTLGLVDGPLTKRVDAEVRAVVDGISRRLSARHAVRPVEIAHTAMAPDVYLPIVLAEAIQYHSPLLAAHAADYSPGVRLRLEMGRYVLAEDYVRAQQLRAVLTAAVDQALDGRDVLVLPALAIPAPPLGAATVDIDGVAEPVRGAMLRLTQVFNITGHPAIALPAGRTAAGLPIGLQLVGRRGATADLLAVAELVEAQITGGAGSVGGGTG